MRYEMQTPGERGLSVYPVSEPGYGVPWVEWASYGGAPVHVSGPGYGAQPVYVVGGLPPDLPPPWVLMGSASASRTAEPNALPNNRGSMAAILLLLF
jgi:hypothetical protein